MTPEPETQQTQGPLHDLAEAVHRSPDQPLLRWSDGAMSTGEFASAARAAAAHLRSYGVQPGDRVAVMAGNSHRVLAVTYGIWMLGAIEVAINAELRGPLLRHVLDDSDPVLVVCGEQYAPLVAERRPELTRLEITTIPLDADGPDLTSVPEPGALASLLYTSGTTGPSKGVMIPHGYFSYFASKLGSVVGLTPDDTCYFSLPFFHVDAHIAVPASLQHGSVFAFAERFSVRAFWTDVERFDATWFGAVGSMLSALATRGRPPESVLDRLRLIMAAPIPDEAYAFFEDELGVPLLQMYGQTEANGPLYSTLDRRRRGAMGWPCAGFDIRVTDDEGTDVPPGAVGELLTRPQRPHIIAQGYWRRPEATTRAFADGWFHTGDLARQDEDGFVWYAGRKTDSLRKRGENVSAYELEQVLRQAPGVLEAAAIAVRDKLGGEDDIKAVLVVDDSFDVADLAAFCRANLPRFAVPRFVEVVPEDVLVRGPGTGAVQKHLLPQGVTDATVDLETIAGHGAATTPTGHPLPTRHLIEESSS